MTPDMENPYAQALFRAFLQSIVAKASGEKENVDRCRHLIDDLRRKFKVWEITNDLSRRFKDGRV